MEVASLKQRPALRGPTPFLRLQGDERLVALTRRGNQSAYEVLVARYQARLLSFCRHMLSSREDAEDVLQEVFAAAFNAMMADDRPINVRPWLYRIARNRSLNHLRKTTSIGVDSMDVHLADHGASTADRVHDREKFRELVGDVQLLPETQRTALLLREMDALSYEQISQAMETTVPAVKSLLVRARVGLAEASEARALSCEEVREELGEVSEGLRRKSPPVRRHVRGCERCGAFDKQLGQTNRALAAVFPVGPLLLLKKFVLAQGASSAAGAAAGAAGGTAAAGAGAGAAGGALSAGVTALATKTAAVMAGAAIVTAGAVEVDHSRKQTRAATASPRSHGGPCRRGARPARRRAHRARHRPAAGEARAGGARPRRRRAPLRRGGQAAHDRAEGRVRGRRHGREEPGRLGARERLHRSHRLERRGERRTAHGARDAARQARPGDRDDGTGCRSAHGPRRAGPARREAHAGPGGSRQRHHRSLSAFSRRGRRAPHPAPGPAAARGRPSRSRARGTRS